MNVKDFLLLSEPDINANENHYQLVIFLWLVKLNNRMI